jgi:hypothetical protein
MNDPLIFRQSDPLQITIADTTSIRRLTGLWRSLYRHDGRESHRAIAIGTRDNQRKRTYHNILDTRVALNTR